MFTDLQIPAGRRPLTSGERVGIVGLCLVFGALMLAALVEDFRPEKYSAVFFVVFWAPMLALHEFGHALAAHALGWRVREIVIGFGPEVWRTRIGETDIVFKLAPIEGYILPAPTSTHRARLKTALIYAAGPGAEFLLLGALILALGWDTVFNHSSDIGLIALKTLAWVIIIGAGFNLLPFKTNGSPSDGLGIITSPFKTDADIELHLVSFELRKIERLQESDETEEALALCSDLVKRFPCDLRLKMLEIEILFADGQRDAARSRIDDVMLTDGISDSWRAHLWLLRVQIELEEPDPDVMEIDRAWNRAAKLAGDPRELLIAKGVALIQRGLYEAGGDLLVRAYRQDATHDHKTDSTILANLAIAAHQINAPEAAHRFRSALESLQPPRRMLDRVRRVMD
jgi:hypothetical protein